MRWAPFCGDTGCACMRPNVHGPCDEYKETVVRRCAECGWPAAEHGLMAQINPMIRIMLAEIHKAPELTRDDFILHTEVDPSDYYCI